jgi:heterogeneous nuclear ribonucleoprotein F/H
VKKAKLVARAVIEPKLAAQLQHDAGYTGVLRLRGLPWAVKESEVMQFFEGFKVKGGRVKDDGVQLVVEGNRAKGDAFVVFESEEEAERALEKVRG